MYYPYGFWGFDPTYFLLIIGMLLSLAASAKLKSTFSVYKKVRSASGLTGAQTAQRILSSAGIYDVQVVAISGNLTDHYDPGTKRVCLSEDVFNRTSLAAVGVAAHECGHAIQHATNYAPLTVRNMVVPATNISSYIYFPLILLGMFLNSMSMIQFGILVFAVIVFFQLITLPVEFNASRRAIATLGSDQVLDTNELTGAKKVLGAAALTYVAALVAAVSQLLQFMWIFGNGND